MNLEELKKPFPVNAISWRVGQKSKSKPKAMMLCYIDARDVMDRLDEVCGSNWSDDYKEVKGRIVCTITIDGVSRSDGAGDTDFEGEKGGLSDAFKRAAVKWGIGRYLYNASEYNTWIDTKDANGKDIPDYDLLKYMPNKEKLDKVARQLSGVGTDGIDNLKNEIKAEKAKVTRELNKKIDEYNKTEGLEMRYKDIYRLVQGMPQINQYGKDKVLIQKVLEVLNDLSNAGKKDAYDALNKLVNDKMLKEEPDEIPVDICEKGIKPEDYLKAG